MTNFNSVNPVDKLERNEVQSLVKIINDLGVELRLVLSLLKETDTPLGQQILEIYNRYEEKTMEVLRGTIKEIIAMRK